ncbi:Xaa-Pro peptidase family protein [Verrucomicrobiaceae bacterium 227]
MIDRDFSDQEMSHRLARIREEMKRDGVDCLLSTDAATVRYATGFRGEPRTLFLSADEALLHTSFRTLSWAEAQTKGIELSRAADPLDEIDRRLSGAKVIGVDSRIPHHRWQELSARWNTAKVKPSAAIDRVRRIKSEDEIDLMRQSQAFNETIFEALLPQIQIGMTEREVQGLILSEIAACPEVDGYSFSPIVAAAGNAWEIHHLPDATPLRAGDLLIVDLGVVHRGYASDMTRGVCLGEPSAEMREVHQVVTAAQDAAFALLRRGASSREVDAAARAVISEAGHARGYTHGLGHSIGLETHDPGLNFATTGEDVPLEPGMVFTVEPGIYLENRFGHRSEDMVVIREDGYENLTRTPRKIFSL